MSAVQLRDGVWLVGGADQEVYTDAHDCHCYLIWDGRHGLLIDAGTGLGADAWLRNVGEVCDPSDVRGLVVTHYHADHAGGSAAAADAGIPVLGHPLTARALADGDEEVTQLARARAAGVYPADYALAPAWLVPVSPGDRVGEGSTQLEIIDAPGHCDGHVVCRWEVNGSSVLFSGDCLFAGGQVSLQAIPDCRLDAYADTVISLAERDTDVLLPGHGKPVLSHAQRDVEAAAGSFRKLIPPRNFLSG